MHQTVIRLYPLISETLVSRNLSFILLRYAINSHGEHFKSRLAKIQAMGPLLSALGVRALDKSNEGGNITHQQIGGYHIRWKQWIRPRG